MRSLPFVSLVLSYAAASVYDLPLECAGRKGENSQECQEPLEDAVTAVIPGQLYIARLLCLDCPTVESSERLKDGAVVENELFFNISLSNDNRTLYLNDVPVFPSFATVPTPTRISASQILPNFTRADIDNSIECAIEICAEKLCSCLNATSLAKDRYVGKANLDFDFYSHLIESDTEKEMWEVTFDVIGGWDNLASDGVWKANNTKQNMLRMVVAGEEIDEEFFPEEKNVAGGGSLFDTPEPLGTVYEYNIVSVGLANRTYTFRATPPTLGFWARLRRLFGLDIMHADGHITYLQQEWGSYGKKGSLRNYFGLFIHEWPWTGIFIILGSTTGGIFALYLACKLYFVVKQQRELAMWDGMDTVWANMRREPEGGDEEGDRLLRRRERYRDTDGEGSYRDESDDDETGPPRYTDEVQTNKPLPSKPLPEKPLPAVPLIDA